MTRCDVALWLLHDVALIVGGGLFEWLRQRNIRRKRTQRAREAAQAKRRARAQDASRCAGA